MNQLILEATDLNGPHSCTLAFCSHGKTVKKLTIETNDLDSEYVVTSCPNKRGCLPQVCYRGKNRQLAVQAFNSQP